MSWYKVTLSAKQVVNGQLVKLQNAFDSQYFAAACLKDMALFSSDFAGKDVLEIYFSPASVQYSQALIKSYGGKPCDSLPLTTNQHYWSDMRTREIILYNI